MTGRRLSSTMYCLFCFLLSLLLSLLSLTSMLKVSLPNWSNHLAFQTSEFSHCFLSGPNGDSHFIVCWTANINENTITFGVGGVTELGGRNVRENADLYLGFGVTEGGMFGADLAIFSPSLGLQDRYSRSESIPMNDPPHQQVHSLFFNILLSTQSLFLFSLLSLLSSSLSFFLLSFFLLSPCFPHPLFSPLKTNITYRTSSYFMISTLLLTHNRFSLLCSLGLCLCAMDTRHLTSTSLSFGSLSLP